MEVSLSILEPVVEYLEQRGTWTRRRATAIVGTAIWTLGLGSALAFNVGADFTLYGKNLFDAFDYLTSNVMLPLGGLLIALYAGRVLSREALAEELGSVPAWLFRSFRFLLRYVTPIGIGVVLVYNLVSKG